MAADSDLIVNIDLLVESESRLKGIQRELKNLGNRNDDMHEHWGSSAISGAMDEFVDNWDDYRAKMQDSVKQVGELVKSTIDGFTGLDAKLAAELRKAQKKK
ncbi:MULTISPECIES: hypothetical protein [unclassified Streptomyces]|uniref:hypothetical protein n=1 Tax=unclassified Streptomyces TaxID=2593676 RepID=UPI00136B8635|nr:MULTISPECIES: hypothetical protein [unclassified Streptomyces]NEA04485.1 hypothetical protein [Streptomyces sp. SID10116]MYY85162.1 hypothetical protein [Streptomyces sp. SID335]MYZ15185.1 hypothetical protein [Streptomyces sp. SID337]NDZ84826.1 hypothetical protein [Streptomyces sp. SID10115]NEB45942.1 hypothetical protein [Streptomyces sp. SID339]